MRRLLQYILIMTFMFIPFLSSRIYAKSSGNYYTVTVLGASIKPLKASGRCWDFRCGNKTRNILKKVEDKAKKLAVRYTVKQLKKMAKIKGLGVLASVDPTGISLALAATSFGVRSYMSGRRMPDPYAILRFSSGYNIKTHVVKDTLSPDWGVSSRVFLKPGDGIQIRVRDKDFRDDDPIGYKHVSITSSMLRQARRKGVYQLSIRGLPQMYSLDILIRRISKKASTGFSPGTYRVTVVDASIRARKRNGRSWDAWRGSPDPFMSFYVGKIRIRTHTVKNTFSPSWNTSKRMYIRGNEKVSIYLYDRDLSNHDTIGACSYSLSRQRLLNGKVLTLECGQARQVTIRFDKE